MTARPARTELDAMVFTPNGTSHEFEYKSSRQDIEYMQLALEEAEVAFDLGNLPVGVVLANENGDTWRAHADEFSSHRLNGHAERNAIEKYNRETGRLMLDGLAMYTTFAPCVGCAHAIDQGELSALFIAANRNDVNEATQQQTGSGAVRSRNINMPEILHDSPRTLLVVQGLLKASSVELFLRRSKQEADAREQLIQERRKGY